MPVHPTVFRVSSCHFRVRFQTLCFRHHASKPLCFCNWYQTIKCTTKIAYHTKDHFHANLEVKVPARWHSNQSSYHKKPFNQQLPLLVILRELYRMALKRFQKKYHVSESGFGHLVVTLKKWRSLFQKWPSLWNDEQMAKVIWNDVTLSDRH